MGEGHRRRFEGEALRNDHARPQNALDARHPGVDSPPGEQPGDDHRRHAETVENGKGINPDGIDRIVRDRR